MQRSFRMDRIESVRGPRVVALVPRVLPMLTTLAILAAGPIRAASAAAPGDVVINEVMQNPAAVSDAAGEWFEIRNATGAPINLDGWTVASGTAETHTIAAGGSLVLPADGYVVLGRSADPATNGGYTPNYVMASITLGNAADFLVLRESGVTIDSVAWDDGATFPDPDGASMELKDPLADNRLGANWAANTTTPYGAGDFGTPGAQNANSVGGSGPPTIANVTHLPAGPIETDTVLVRADVTDDLGVAEVCIEYRVNGGASTGVAAALLSGATYQSRIPPQPAGSTVAYIVVARDVDGNVTLAPPGAPTSAFSYTVGGFALTISLNEVLADPPTAAADSTQGDVNRDGVGDTFQDEFVEVVNYGTVPVDISGWTLSDDDSPGSEFAFPAGTVVPSLGFVTLFGGGSPQGYSGLVFTDDGRIGNGLGNTGDTVELRRAGALVDVLVFGAEGGNNESMIRVPDGTGAWTTPGDEGFSDPYTPHAPNGGGLTATQPSTWGKIKAIFR